MAAATIGAAWPALADEVPAAVAPAPAIVRVDVEGAHAIDSSEIRRILAVPCPPESLAPRLARVAHQYYDRGYLDATLRPEPDSTGTLRLAIREGHPARISQVLLRGMKALSEPLCREVLALAPGDIFRPDNVEARLAALAEAYARRGYLDAEATLERLDIAPEGVLLGIVVSEGEASRLDEVTVQGNTTTRAALVQRLAGLEIPRAADAARIREAPQLLRRSGLFEDVGEPVLYRLEGSEGIGVLLPVVESERKHSVFGALGLARDPGRSGAYLAGAVDLALRNIYGTGRDLALDWRRDALTGSRLAIGYRERYFLGSPLDFGFDLSQTVRDSTSTWQTAGLQVTVPIRRNVGLECGGALDRSVYHIGLTGNTLRWRSRLGVRVASLSREADGTRWGTFELYGEYARRRNDLVLLGTPDHDRVDQTIVGGHFDAGLALARHHGIAARAEWHAVESDALPIPETELYEFGGARTLRGYREGQFRGDRVVFGGFEYRYGDPRGARLYGFVDAGAYARRLGGGLQEDDFKVGYGAGLRAAVATGALDLAFGLGDEGHSLSAVKLHVSLMQRF